MKYIICSGWWCDQESEDGGSYRVGGDSAIRSSSFHDIWYRSIDAFTNPEKILIVDSNSPTPPRLNPDDRRLEYLRLPSNPGHSTMCSDKFCGWSQSAILGMQYALACGVDYVVYVEQDALLYGNGIIEHAIRSMSSPYAFGGGANTPQALQQSFFIIRSDGIADFLNRLLSFSETDREMAPELKFALATSPLLTACWPVLRWRKRKKWVRLFRKRPSFDLLPFGSGRARPIDFSEPFFYFQHGTREELAAYSKRSGIKIL